MKTLIGADNNNLGGEEEEDACTMRTHAGIISRNIFVALFFRLDVLLEATTLTSTELIHQSSARITIVSDVFILPPLSEGTLVRRVIIRMAGDIGTYNGRCDASLSFEDCHSFVKVDQKPTMTMNTLVQSSHTQPS